MEVKKIYANEKVKEDSGMFAIQRGPLVYCLEGLDQESGQVMNIASMPDAVYSTEFSPSLLNGINIIKFEGIEDSKEVLATAIPYYSWANREASEMKVWIPYVKN